MTSTWEVVFCPSVCWMVCLSPGFCGRCWRDELWVMKKRFVFISSLNMKGWNTAAFYQSISCTKICNMSLVMWSKLADSSQEDHHPLEMPLNPLDYIWVSMKCARSDIYAWFEATFTCFGPWYSPHKVPSSLVKAVC